MKLRPLSHFVHLKAEPRKEKAAGGNIILTDNHRQPIRTARVLAVGPGKQEGKHFIKTELKPGDRVALFQAHFDTSSAARGMAFLLGGDETLIPERDCLFVIEKGEDVEIDM